MLVKNRYLGCMIEIEENIGKTGFWPVSSTIIHVECSSSYTSVHEWILSDDFDQCW